MESLYAYLNDELEVFVEDAPVSAPVSAHGPPVSAAASPAVPSSFAPHLRSFLAVPAPDTPQPPTRHASVSWEPPYYSPLNSDIATTPIPGLSPFYQPSSVSPISRSASIRTPPSKPVLPPLLSRLFRTPQQQSPLPQLSPLTPLSDSSPPVHTPPPPKPRPKKKKKSKSSKNKSFYLSPTPASTRNTRYHLRAGPDEDEFKIPNLPPRARRSPVVRSRLPSIVSSRSQSTSSSPAVAPHYTKRTFPSTLQIDDVEFSLFYRRFPFPSARLPPNNSTPNPPRHPHDLYTPRFVRGTGAEKVGVCPICHEEGRELWLAMKFSAFNYHMQYVHGISASSTAPFSPPLSFRTVRRPDAKIAKLERVEMREGLCHKCDKWVPVQGVKDVDVKVKEMFWWKHAAACHAGSRIDGERDDLEEIGDAAQ